MEPPLIAAENWSRGVRQFSSRRCFNGAAAHRGGERACRRPPDRGEGGFNGAAAHRGGERAAPCPSRCTSSSFNGAAAHRGGEPRSRRRGRSRPPRFNGAAAHRGGEHPVDAEVRTRILASMEPPLIAAENQLPASAVLRAEDASMEPPLIAAENLDAPERPVDVGAASMEPPLIAAENLLAKLDGLWESLLQWSRRSSRRRTRSTRTTSSR